ncbi:MAG: hypothetical protein CMJ84_12830 [Planctomycetes bacterium]|jgi:hypothetical protein|nr:hypothetical protein [Planctomycetota bacterium]MDP6408872.1 hypothetical protein [Planctomycetota bacterium]
MNPLLPVLSVFATSAPLAPATVPLPQQGAFEVHRPEHVRLLHAEREALLREEWVRAGAQSRRRAIEWVHSRRRPGEPAGARISFETLADISRFLDGGTPDAGSPWTERLARSLDLRVAPGVFAAREQGRGESMVVRVETLFAVPAPEGDRELLLSLVWLGPAGEEVPARTEPVPTTCFDGSGFEMFVRPPASEPGRWRLVADVGRGAECWRSVAVGVDCVADLAARRARLQLEAQRAPSPLRAELWSALGPLTEHGLRRLAGLDLGHWFDFCEGSSAVELTSPVVPFPPEGAMAAADRALWTLPHEGTFERGLVIVCGRAEHPSDALAGAVGEGWRRFSLARSTRVLAGACPTTSRAAVRFLERCAALATERDWTALHLVARGDQGTLFLRELRRTSAPSITGLVLCATSGAVPDAGAEFGVPLLTFTAMAAEDATTSGDGWARVASREPGFLLDLRVPGLVETWLSEGL